MRWLSFRRRVALLICPELLSALVVVQAPAPEISAQTEHVIRLGRLFLAAQGAATFPQALGVPGFVQDEDGIYRWWWDWSAFSRRPPIRVTDRVYARFVGKFSEHWPRDLDWPRDIPRPPKSKKEAA